MRRRLTPALWVALLLVWGCTPKPYTGSPRDLHAQLKPRAAAVVPAAPRLGETPGALGPEAPYLPLVQPPEVRRVWITAHLNDLGDLVAGHWVYLMLRPSQWFLRDYQGPQALQLQLPRSPVVVEAVDEQAAP